MKKLFAIVVFVLTSISTFAASPNAPENLRIGQLILNSQEIMETVEAELKSLLPSLKMKFIGISVNSTPTRYSAIITYEDTAKSTFFNPSFGKCSLLLRGKVFNQSVSLDLVKEDDCGE